MLTVARDEVERDDNRNARLLLDRVSSVRAIARGLVRSFDGERRSEREREEDTLSMATRNCNHRYEFRNHYVTNGRYEARYVLDGEEFAVARCVSLFFLFFFLLYPRTPLRHRAS